MNYIQFVRNFATKYLSQYLDIDNFKIIYVTVDASISSITTVNVECVYNKNKEFFTIQIFKDKDTNKIDEILFTLLFECFSFMELRLINKSANKQIRKDLNK